MLISNNKKLIFVFVCIFTLSNVFILSLVESTSREEPLQVAMSVIKSERSRPETLDDAIEQVQQMLAEGRSREDVASFVSDVVDRRVTNANSLERMTDPANWWLWYEDNPREVEFNRFRSLNVFDYEETANWLWDSQYAQCDEISNLTYYILKKAGVEGNIRILTSYEQQDAKKERGIFSSLLSLVTGELGPSTHNYVVWGIKDGADTENPATWGKDALIVDPWAGSTLTAEEAKDNSLYFEGKLVSDNTTSYDKDAMGWEIDQRTRSRSGEPFNFDCLFASAFYGYPRESELAMLRQFRDDVLLSNPMGRQVADLYYRCSPSLAAFIAPFDLLRGATRVFFAEPLVNIVAWITE